MDSLVNFITDIIYNATSMPDFLYKKEMVVISSENLEQIYQHLLLKTLSITFLTLLSSSYVGYKMFYKPSVAEVYIDDSDDDSENDQIEIKEIELDTNDESDISDAKSDYSGSNVSITDVEKSIKKNQELVAEMSKKMHDDLAINSTIYQNARRSNRFK